MLIPEKYKLLIGSLNRPYRLFESKKNRLRLSVGIALFVWFFLFTFGVFDFDFFSLPERLYYTGIYSISCFITLFINFYILQDFLVRKYTLLKSLLWGLWFIFCIGSSNFLLTAGVFKWESFSLNVFLKNQSFTLFLALIIAPSIMLVYYSYSLRRRIGEIIQTGKESELYNKDDYTNKILLIQSEYKRNSLNIESANLLYIQSSDNYLDIYYLENNKVNHRFVRNTLSWIEKSKLHPDLVRCHRSFIININNVLSVKSNPSGYKVIMKYIKRDIPLSRKYRNKVLSLLNK